MRGLICWLRGLWWTYRTPTNFIPISGHNFIQQPSFRAERDGRKVIVEPLKCESCGHVSEAWRPLYGETP